MGYDYGAVIGKFIILDKPLFKKEVEINICKNVNCDLFSEEINNKFCSECGELITKKKISIEIDIADFLYNNNIDYFKFNSDLPNIIYTDDSVMYHYEFYEFKNNIEIKELSYLKFNQLKKELKEKDIKFDIMDGSFLTIE